jgi:hypothetical protein
VCVNSLDVSINKLVWGEILMKNVNKQKNIWFWIVFICYLCNIANKYNNDNIISELMKNKANNNI